MPRRPCSLDEAGHAPHQPVFAEILDRSGHGTGQFVRLSQGMVEKITREARGAATAPSSPQLREPAAETPAPRRSTVRSRTRKRDEPEGARPAAKAGAPATA
ncbi:MAG: hypothetical protein PGN34_07890 [Methylobacterium frigidaeris]